jgi:hypothetical protein
VRLLLQRFADYGFSSVEFPQALVRTFYEFW